MLLLKHNIYYIFVNNCLIRYVTSEAINYKISLEKDYSDTHAGNAYNRYSCKLICN